MLRGKNLIVLASAAFALLPIAARAVPLSVVNVGAPAINCVFNTTCTVTVSDSIGNFTPPGDSGNGRLQSRTYTGVAPAPGAGDGAHEYRVDLTNVQGITAANCVTAMQLTFGPVVKLPYTPGGQFDVFVVTSGGLGSVGLASAIKTGSTIRFNFAAPVCPGATSYFFGLASHHLPPVMSKARLFYSLGGSALVDARVP
ncbi:MAG TPA: hypothetical protein VMU08_16025 [Rhizomicrobium sp.]|nr:hypothetical protein [Rhizomicrobium sp.]